MGKEEFIKELEKINITLTDDQLSKLDKYYELLIEYNKVMNLTGITKYEDVLLKHFYDSLTLIKAIDLTKKLSLCDVGTGAGFPGVVLKIVFPNLKVTLIDSLNKRITFLNKVIEDLGLTNIEALHYRMEDYSIKNEEKFDIITSRAVDNLTVLLELSIKSLKINGLFIAMKGNCEEEVNILNKYINNYSCTLKNVIKFTLPIENSNRTLVVIKKNDKTNKKYPRKYKVIKEHIL